jgi:hypothetical protein
LANKLTMYWIMASGTAIFLARSIKGSLGQLAPWPWESVKQVISCL